MRDSGSWAITPVEAIESRVRCVTRLSVRKTQKSMRSSQTVATVYIVIDKTNKMFFRAVHVETTDQEHKCGEPPSPVKTISNENDDTVSSQGDTSSPLYEIAKSISWRDMNLFIDLLEDGKEGKVKLNPSSLLRRSQSCTKVHCETANPLPSKEKTRKPRRSSIGHKIQPTPPRRFSWKGSMIERVRSMRNIWGKQESSIPMVVVVKDIHCKTPAKNEELGKPARPTFSRQSSSTRKLTSIGKLSSGNKQPTVSCPNSSNIELASIEKTSLNKQQLKRPHRCSSPRTMADFYFI
jgi:hypothetical protein